MFEDLIKELERLNGSSVSVSIECDEHGYVDKQCPSDDCEFLFKVNEEDWENIFQDEAVWCPLCRHEAPSDNWFTIEQIEHAKSEALAIVNGKINNALKSGAQKFNRSQSRNKFISMTMKVSSGINRTHTIPARAAEKMQLEILCEKCNSRFAVIGSAFFCPSCGHNSVSQTYSDSLRKILAKKDNADSIKNSLIETVGKDEAELVYRSLKETCISDGVVAFQRYCEGLFSSFEEPPFNAFQRLKQGSKLWKKVVGKGYEDWLTEDEIYNLNILFQKRHILSHNEGIVDSHYIKNSKDSSYQKGQRIIVSDKDIELLLVCIEKLGIGIKEACDAKKA